MSLPPQAEAIELILSDVDGVLTDGGIVFDNQGIETKRFHIHDGLGIKLWQRCGFRFGLITGRNSHIVKVRAAELGIEVVRQGREEKLATARQIAEELGLEPGQVAYVGDDLPDLAVIRWAGIGVSVPNGVPEVREAADFVTERPGGGGAIRELVERLLKAKGRWEDVVQQY